MSALSKWASKLVKSPVTWGVTTAAGAAGTTSLLASQAINAGRESPEVLVVNQPSNKTMPDGVINETTDNSLGDMAMLMYLMNQSKGGGGGTNVSEPETTGNNGFDIMAYLPWIVGIAGVGIIAYLLFSKKKGRR